MKIAHLLMVAGVLCGSLIAHGAAYPVQGELQLGETWADGDRTNQVLPHSSAWFSSAASGTLTSTSANGGSMTQTTAASSVDITYFTKSVNAPVILEMGQTLRMTYKISYSGLLNPGAYTRLGLFDASAKTRATADATGTSSASLFGGISGYIVEYGGTAAGTTCNIRRREQGSSSTNLLTTTATAGNPYTNLSSLKTGNFTLSEVLASGTIYDCVFEVTRTSDTRIDIHASMSRPDGMGGQVVVYNFSSGNDNADRLYHQFDMAGFAVAEIGRAHV